MSRARRTPPSGATFTTIRSAAPARATLSGSSSLRTLSSAAISTGTPAARSRRRTSARPAMSGTGCSAYSSPTPASRVSAATAVGTSQPPFASTRIAASGSAARTAATRAASSSRRLPGLGHLDFDGVHPAEAGQDFRDPVRGDGGDRGVDRDAGPQRLGEALPAGLDGGGEPAGGFRVAVFREGAELAPAQRAVQQQGLALEDAAELHPHRQADHVRAGEEFLQRGEPRHLADRRVGQVASGRPPGETNSTSRNRTPARSAAESRIRSQRGPGRCRKSQTYMV